MKDKIKVSEVRVCNKPRLNKTTTENNMAKKLQLDIKTKFEAKTENQSNYLRSIAENDITLCHGCSGTGKTYLAVGMACQYLTQNRISQIILTRPMVQSGRGLGYLKGDLKEKFEPYLMPLLEELEKFVGKGSYLAEQGVVRMIPLELMRGMNFHDSFMILDECQNATFDQMKMFMTRLGKNSKAVLCGDIKQTDLSGFDYGDIVDKLSGLEGIGISQLDKRDIQRNGLIGKILSRLED